MSELCLIPETKWTYGIWLGLHGDGVWTLRGWARPKVGRYHIAWEFMAVGFRPYEFRGPYLSKAGA